MPRVVCFQVPGITCWFWSNDHNPPHFHAKKAGEWEIRVRFLEDASQMFELIWGDEPSAKMLRSIAKAVEVNRPELLAEWEVGVNRG